MSSILVTGGAGFIGSHFVDLMIKDGHHVVVLDSLTYAAQPRFLPKNSILVKGSICDKELVSKTMSEHQIDTIINIAAESHVDRSIAGATPFIETNIFGTFTLIECAMAQWKKIGDNFRYLQVSTDEVYGSLGDTGQFVEQTPIDPRSPYAASKASADLLVQAWNHTYGLPTIITRCSNNFGPRQYPEKLIPTVILAAIEGRNIPVYGAGQNVRDWIFVEDHCQGIKLALEKGVTGEVYCFGGDHEARNIDLVNKICEILNSFYPLSMGRCYKDQITFVEDRLGHDYRYSIDFAYAKEKLGFQPQNNFLNNLEKTVLWYVDNYTKLKEVG